MFFSGVALGRRRVRDRDSLELVDIYISTPNLCPYDSPYLGYDIMPGI
jgi:hypothetical protein